MSERLLTARELGEILSLSTATVLDRFERGDLPGFRLFGRKGGPVRFRLSELEVALDTWRVNGRARGGEVAPVPFQAPALGRSVSVAPVPHRGGENDAG